MGGSLVLSLLALVQVGDPQIGTDHPYFPGEKAMSTPARVRDFSNAVPRGSLTAANDREKLIRLFLWRAEHFSWWMTSMLHRFHDESPFHHRLQHSQLQYVTGSRAAATMLAENYVGLPY